MAHPADSKLPMVGRAMNRSQNFDVQTKASGSGNQDIFEKEEICRRRQGKTLLILTTHSNLEPHP
jgi:hypothetical protein